MSGGVDQVEDILLPVFCPVDQTHGLRLDCNSPFPLEVHIVQDLILHLTAGQKTGLFNHPVRQRGLPVINMRHDAEIPYILLSA